MQECSNSIANPLELPPSYTKPSIWDTWSWWIDWHFARLHHWHHVSIMAFIHLQLECFFRKKIIMQPQNQTRRCLLGFSFCFRSDFLLLLWWRHQMEAFSAHFPRYWSFVRGIHRSPVNSPHKGQWRWALMFSLICVWINGWVNNGDAGDLRRYRAHNDVPVMSTGHLHILSPFTNKLNSDLTLFNSTNEISRCS